MSPCTYPYSLSLVGSHLVFYSDYAIVGSDSGRIVILDYDPKTSSFVKVHQETYGKSGARRIVPGQYLATDPKGRSVMVAAMEKAKLVYILNRDVAANLTISSPLEAHKNAAIIHHIVGLDVGFENPMFAALEVDYTESDQDPTGEAFNNADKVRVRLVVALKAHRSHHLFVMSPCNMIRFSLTTSSIWDSTTLSENGASLQILGRTCLYKFLVVNSLPPIVMTALQACSYAARITSFTGTSMYHNTVFLYRGESTH